jgi:uncharacterized protein YecE (DUF72 family)
MLETVNTNGNLTVEENNIKIGCCGFSAAQARYRELFPVIEVQQTFYQPPQPATLERWRADFPTDFEFTLKAWQLITHKPWSKTYQRLKVKLNDQELKDCGFFQDTAIVRQAWETTLLCANILEARLVLFQCPATFKPTPANLELLKNFFSTVRRGNLKFLWEPRGDWPDELLIELCQDLDLVHVSDPFIRPTVTPSLTYYRLHGGEGFRHVYEDFELENLLNSLQPQKKNYVMFNNINMLEDAQRFQALVKTKTH